MRGWILLMLCGLVGAPALAQQRMIYDDDCSRDVDCVATLPILHALEDRNEIRILAMMADSANPLSAPVLNVFAKYGGHPKMPIGANQSDEPSTELCRKNGCNMSPWSGKLVERFDAGDTRTKYPDCVVLYRQMLTRQPEHSVAIAATGFATCLRRLIASPADMISPLSGAELVKQKVKLLSVMGGGYPTGSEWNFQSDAPGYHGLFMEWTRQHGYPPVYLNGFANGEHIMAGASATADPMVNPTRYALRMDGFDQRPMWDMLSVLFAARGLSFDSTVYFKVGQAGTVEVNAETGANTWSAAVNSGHYVLTDVASDELFSALFDGYAHTTGFLAKTDARRFGR